MLYVCICIIILWRAASYFFVKRKIVISTRKICNQSEFENLMEGKLVDSPHTHHVQVNREDKTNTTTKDAGSEIKRACILLYIWALARVCISAPPPIQRRLITPSLDVVRSLATSTQIPLSNTTSAFQAKEIKDERDSPRDPIISGRKTHRGLSPDVSLAPPPPPEDTVHRVAPKLTRHVRDGTRW